MTETSTLAYFISRRLSILITIVGHLSLSTATLPRILSRVKWLTKIAVCPLLYPVFSTLSGVNSCSYGGVICDDTQVINDKPAEAHAYMHSYMRAYMYYLYTHCHMYICAYTYTHTYTHTMYVYVFIHTCVCICMYTYTQICIHVNVITYDHVITKVPRHIHILIYFSDKVTRGC